ncbi:MAG: aminodeoxychorismate/anthranilate synthase component II [Thiohalomonadales bacterium]
MLLMIDNYDSFTYNLVQYFGELDTPVDVYRNDKIDIAYLQELPIERLVISPGPCTPDKAGISMAAIEAYTGKLPILGVCLGHQSICQVFGGEIVHAGKVMHGKVSNIYHNNSGVFSGLPNPFVATRYHSLVVDKDSLPDCLQVTAWTLTAAGEVEEIMGVKHSQFAIEGVQFHPESISTQAGHDLLHNFLHQ